MGEQTYIPVTYDSDSSYIIKTTKNDSDEYFQQIQLTDGDSANPSLINPATDEKLDDIISEVGKIGVSGLTTQLEIGTSATELTAGMSSRRSFVIRNCSDRIDLYTATSDAEYTLFVGYDPAMTTSNGFVLAPGESFSFDGDLTVYGLIGDVGKTVLTSIMEVK